MFRDDYTALTATGLAIYGLSRDSLKANTSFKNKQNLPYTLLCDPSAALISAIGMKKGGGTARGVFVVDKNGKVLAAEAGGPGATVAAVKKIVDGASGGGSADIEMANAPAEPAPVKTATPATPVAESAPEAIATEKATIAPEPAAAPAVAAPPAAEEAPSATTQTPTAPAVAPAASPAETKIEAPIVNGEAEKRADDAAQAKVAADVADTAAKLDPATPNPA